MQSSDSFHGFGYTFWTFWIIALHLLYKLWISNILAMSITEETCIVEMRIWCKKIGTVNFIIYTREIIIRNLVRFVSVLYPLRVRYTSVGGLANKFTNGLLIKLTVPIVLHQMRISTIHVSSVMLLAKIFEIQSLYKR